ncbi:Alpha/Beta hydrolase protein [Phycomyces blakesleeanus]|uniref:AB hydrolase-1 domain-containing protein n=2 Tax=Phycomyces blakesleeanus TaxID=4837 RepID=A0A163AZK4_PHYB8|nr:hypothetical protein PHYBLDRAFT_122902 [Phycomyces blakesleeanus NRRL 1555(-)]OAD76721.1 hypothetical protein PHYBLDRAFT_122902 [Phycomyces blakesleeanus NRRL 1555(-)]|eukprot:XP_018294761.1 hypothetical protein PHYBLDRAFT_122902 [Phycomyces blakesleeanus NRRL 1555(-)]
MLSYLQRSTTVKFSHNSDPVKIPLNTSEKTSLPLDEFIAQTCPSLIGPQATYTPTPYLFNGHLQTGYSANYNKLDPHTLFYERELLKMPDGGQVSLDWTLPLDKRPLGDTPTLVCLHGLTGGSHESYIRGVLELITSPPFNYRGVVLNARGCGNTEITTPRLFNAAYTDDIREVVKHIQSKLAPGTPLIAIGFSLGANILVKYLGEEGEKAPFKAALSIGNPFDLLNANMAMIRGPFTSRVYDPHMAANLRGIFAKHIEIMSQNKDIDPEKVINSVTIREFDETCTRRVAGYSTVLNYYRDGSSCRFVEHVRIPLLCINAMDDPVAVSECIPYDEITINPYVVLATTDYGGHLGWFEYSWKPTRWINKPIAEFIVAMFQVHDIRTPEFKKTLDPKAVDAAVDNFNS